MIEIAGQGILLELPHDVYCGHVFFFVGKEVGAQAGRRRSLRVKLVGDKLFGTQKPSVQGGRDNFVEGLLVASQTAFSEKSDAIADNPLLGKVAVRGVVWVRMQPVFRIGKRLGRDIDLLEVVIEVVILVGLR